MTRALASARLPRRGFLGRALAALAAPTLPAAAAGAGVASSLRWVGEEGVELIGRQVGEYKTLVTISLTDGPPPAHAEDGEEWWPRSGPKLYRRGGRWVTDREIVAETGAPGLDDPHDDCGGRWA